MASTPPLSPLVPPLSPLVPPLYVPDPYPPQSPQHVRSPFTPPPWTDQYSPLLFTTESSLLMASPRPGPSAPIIVVPGFHSGSDTTESSSLGSPIPGPSVPSITVPKFHVGRSESAHSGCVSAAGQLSPVLIHTSSQGTALSLEHVISTRSSSPTSSLELIAPSPSKAAIMQENIHFLSSVSSSSISAVARLYQILDQSTKMSTKSSSPPSAAALSSSMVIPRAQPLASAYRPPIDTGVASPNTRRNRHPLYYLKDEMVVLRVESRLYRIYRKQLEDDSAFFRCLFMRMSRDEGTTDATAITLEGISDSDFECLLDFMYYKVYEPHSVDTNEWKVILRVATHLELARIRMRAICELAKQLDNVDPVEVVVLATRHGIPEWLPKAYEALCSWDHPLTDDEAEQLGARTAARIARVREEVREERLKAFRCACTCYPDPTPLDDTTISKLVMEEFWPAKRVHSA